MVLALISEVVSANVPVAGCPLILPMDQFMPITTLTSDQTPAETVWRMLKRRNDKELCAFCSKNVARKRKFLRGKKKFNMSPKKVSFHVFKADLRLFMGTWVLFRRFLMSRKQMLTHSRGDLRKSN